MTSLIGKSMLEAERLGISLLEEYTYHDVKIKFYVHKGEYKGLTGFIDYTGLRRSKQLSYNSLDSESKRAYQDRIAKSKNCCIVIYADGYKVNAPITVKDIYGTHYTTTFTELKRRKPFGEVSLGESTIAQLLSMSGYSYTRQYKIKTNVGNQYCDFFIHSLNTVIEYDGIQHFEEVPYFSKTLSQVKLYDKEKELRLAELGISVIRVPYTISGYDKISKYLISKGIHIKEEVYIEQVPLTDSEFIAYYKNHTRDEVSSKFNISKESVTKIAKSLGFVKKKQEYDPELLQSVEQLYIVENKPRAVVASKLNISPSTVSKYSKKLGYRKVNSRNMTQSKIKKI